MTSVMAFSFFEVSRGQEISLVFVHTAKIEENGCRIHLFNTLASY